MRTGATILMYHRLSDRVVLEDEALYTISPARFEEHMRALVGAGYRIVPAEELARPASFPLATALTFDDGCSSDFLHALPVLKSLGLTATFFVNPGRVGEAHFSSWDQIATLASEGMSIGSHGLDHCLLEDIELSELERQLSESKALLEQRLGFEITLLSLPGGTGVRTAPAVARRLGYRVVFGSEPARVRGGEEVLPRFAIRRHETASSLLDLVGQKPYRLARERARYRALSIGRKLAGPLYERVRGRWFERATRMERT